MKTEFLNLIGEDGEDSFEVYIAENDIDVSYLIMAYAKELEVTSILDAMNFEFNINESRWNILDTPIDVVFNLSYKDSLICLPDLEEQDEEGNNFPPVYQWDIKINNNPVGLIFPPQAFWVVDNIIYYSYKEACEACKMPYYKIEILPDFSYNYKKDYDWDVDPKYVDWID